MLLPSTVAATALLGGFAIITLSACGSSVAGSGSSTTGTGTVAAAAATGQASGQASGASAPNPSGPSGPHTTTTGGGQQNNNGGGSTSSSAPGFVYATVTCVVTDYEDLPGLSHIPLYNPQVTWQVKHATGMALSVDNPGLVGAYGTYGKSGRLTLGGGCYRDDSPTTVELYTVGGHGRRAHKTIVLHGTHNHVTAPPLSGGSSTPPSTAPSS